MGRRGFGHGVARQRPQTHGSLIGTSALGRLSPGVLWDGTEGSGFSSVPTDPERTTAKPALRLIEPPSQSFTNSLTVGALAFANNNGTLIDGIEKVRFHYEGNAIDVFGPTTRALQRADGSTFECLGYWIELLKPYHESGDAQLYIEAFASDPTMQNRIIGPYRFSPVDQLHDFDLTVSPSQPLSANNFHEVSDAIDFLKGEAARNPRILVTEPHPSGFYGLPLTLGIYGGGKGRCLIQASTPVTFGYPGFTNDAAAVMRPRYDGLHFQGSNITFDMRFVSHIVDEEMGELPWFDRVNFTISGEGRGEYWRKGTRPLPWIARNGAWWTECSFNNVKEPVIFSPLARGCIMEEGYGDVATDALCIIGNRIRDWTSAQVWQVNAEALSISGPADSTVSITGGNDTNGRVITAKVNGTSVDTFTVGSGETYFTGAAGDGYTVQDVADWINGLAGWSASVLDDTRRASALSLAGQKGAAVTDVDTSSAVTFVTYFDLHTDWYSQNQAGPEENVISFGNITSGFKGQSIFITADKGAKDFFFVNDAFDNEPDLNLSQLEGPHSHVVIAHVSSTTQNLLLRVQTDYDPDSYCLIANSAFSAITWSTIGTPDPDLTITNNVVDQGSPNPQFSTGTTVGGTPESKYVETAIGDFTAIGELLDNAKATAFTFDAEGRPRGGTEPAGAIGLGVAEAPEYPSPAPVVFAPPQEEETLKFASVRFPAENGEDANGVNGGLAIPNSNALLERASPGDTPLLATDGALAVLWKVPRKIYDGLKRSPIILGTDRSAASSAAANQLRLSYVSGADNSNPANVGKFRLFLQGAPANGSLNIYSDALPDSFSDWLMITPRVSAGSISLDVFDLASGVILAGPSTALPAGWAGVSAFARDLGLGIFRPDQFPQDHTDLFGNTGYARGECAGLLFLETSGSDEDWASFAKGSDPIGIWPGEVRAWFPLTDGTALDLARQSNLATDVAFSDDLVQLGTLLPGSTARGQSETQFLRVKDLPDPALIPVYHATMRGDFRVTLSMSGQTAGAAIEALFLDDADVIHQDWTNVGTAVSHGDVTVTANLEPRIYRAKFRIVGGNQCEVNSDIVVGPGIVFNGQSQCDFTFGLGLDELDGATTNFAFDAGVGERTFVAARSRVGTASLQKPALFRAAQKPGTVGDGFIAAANGLAASAPSHWPIILIETSVSGTTIADTLADDPSPTPTSSDNRDMADIYAITDLLMGRDAQDRAVITCWTQFWHSSGSVVAYAESFLPPLLDGTATTAVPVVDDYPYSGASIHPVFPFVHLEPNRIISASATSDPATTQDTRIEHQTRQNLRDNEGAFAYILGAPSDVHRLEQDIFTHPAPGERYGSRFVAENAIQSVKPVLGLAGGYEGPVAVQDAVFVDTDNLAIDVTFTGPAGFALGVLNEGTVSGFEVGDDVTGFTASIIADDIIRLTKHDGAWGSDIEVELKPGGPGNYGAGHDESAYVDGALVNTVDGCLVRGTGAAIVATGGGTNTTGPGDNPEEDLIAAMDVTGGQSAYHDYTLAGGSPWNSPDQTVNGNDHTQTISFRFPGSNGEFDGTTAANQAISGGLFTVTLAFTKNDASTRGFLVAISSNPGLQYLQGSNIPLPYTTKVDGVVIATENDLYNAFHQSGQVVVEMTGVDRDGDTILAIGRNSASAQGTIPKVAIIDEAAMGVQLEQARANALLAVVT